MKTIGQISKDENWGGTQITYLHGKWTSYLGFGNLYNIQPHIGEFKKILPPTTMHCFILSFLRKNISATKGTYFYSFVWWLWEQYDFFVPHTTGGTHLLSRTMLGM